MLSRHGIASQVVHNAVHDSVAEKLQVTLTPLFTSLLSVGSAEYGYIATLTHNNYLQPLLSAGVPLQNLSRLHIEDTAVSARTVREGKINVSTDGAAAIQGDPWLSGVVGLRSWLSLPLICSAKVKGILVLASSSETVFEDHGRIDLLNSYAGAFANLIQATEFQESIYLINCHQFTGGDETAIVLETMNLAHTRLRISHATMCIVTDQQQRSFKTESLSWEHLVVPSGIMDAVIRQGIDQGTQFASQSSENTDDQYPPGIEKEITIQERVDGSPTKGSLRSLLGVPLSVGQEFVGVFIVIARRWYAFASEDRILLHALASKAAATLLMKRLEQRFESELITIVQMTKPGFMAMSFVHDAKHSMHQMNALISALISLIPKGKSQSATVREIVSSLSQSTQYLTGLLNGLAASAKPPRRERVTVASVLNGVSYLLQPRLGTISLHLPSEQHMNIELVCYPDQLEQLFLNLTMNSIDAIRENQHKTGAVFIEMTADDERVTFVIQDDGIGIRAADLGSIFSPSYSTKDKAAGGFGLAICKRIVEDNHKGSLRVHSTFGRGTKFVCDLPRRLGDE